MVDKNYAQILNRIQALEKQYQELQNSSTIPLNIDKAFLGRGYLKNNSLFYVGRVEIGAAGVSRIPIPGANGNSIAFATDAIFPATGVEAYIEFSTDHYDLHLEGIATTVVNFVVFLNNTGDFNDLT